MATANVQEYDIDWSEMTAREKLAIQKQRLLGLDLFADFNGQAGGISGAPVPPIPCHLLMPFFSGRPRQG